MEKGCEWELITGEGLTETGLTKQDQCLIFLNSPINFSGAACMYNLKQFFRLGVNYVLS